MLRAFLSSVFVVGFAVAACSRTPLDSAASGCADGDEICGGTCVPTGTCKPGPSGGAGGSLVGGKGGTAAGGGTGATAAGGTGGFSVGGTGGSSFANIVCNDVGSLQQTMSTQYDGAFVSVNGSRKQYYFQTNWWGLYNGQTVALSGLSYTLGNPLGAQSYDNNPTGYPSLFIGTYSGHATIASNLPKQVSALTQVPTVISTNASSMGTSNYNASYDVWFTADSSPLPSYQYDPGPSGAYLMVWLFMPSDRQPRGFAAHPAQTVAGLPGTWTVWIDYSNPPCISYVSTTPLDLLEFDLNNVIQHAVKNDYGITSSMYLSIIFGGFEVWGGGDGLQLTSFCANVL